MNFWDVHGVLFIICMFFFPRLTLLFSSVPFGGFLWWLGFIFAPRILVAILASFTYWETNPILVLLSSVWALGGESAEKKTVSYRVRKYSNRNYDDRPQMKDVN